MIILSVILGILVYAFLGRVFHNVCFTRKSRWNIECIFTKSNWEDPFDTLVAVVFPITLVVIILVCIFKLPMKLADIACNPENYKFKIKIEKK